MQNHIRNTNLRFNLEKDLQRKAWEYLQSMNRQEFKSYSHVIALALVDYFDRYYRIAEDPYLETREREERFITNCGGRSTKSEAITSTFSLRSDCGYGTNGVSKTSFLDRFKKL